MRRALDPLAVVPFVTLTVIAGCGVEGGKGDGKGTTSSGGTASSFGGSSSSSGGTDDASTGGAGSATSSAGGSASGGNASGGAGSAEGPGTPAVPNEFCAGLAYEEDVTVAASQTDRMSWNDQNCQPRTAAMARLPRGYLRQFTYMLDGNQLTATGTGVNGHLGWGFAVNHGLSGFSAGGPIGSGSYQAIYVGAHHGIYEYKLEHKDISLTMQWFFASGRDNPVIAITYDLTAAKPGLGADQRTPYGDIAWDGDENAPNTIISGVGWGDRYKFTTTQAPLTRSSTWDYSQPNLVPYVHQWADASDTEMGVVQTQTYLQKDAGGYWLYKNWGKTSANQERDEGQVGEMPVSWNWPYQMNQYELCYPEAESCVEQPTRSHRLGWGTNYGAVGGTDAAGMYPSYGDDKQLSGYPYQSYSVIMVMGKHSAESVFSQVREIETVQKTSLSASSGSVVTELPSGVARTDMVALEPPGYDARFSTWNVAADANEAEFSLTVSEGALRNPVLVISNFTGSEVPSVSLDGAALEADVDYLASVDTAEQKVWITLRATLQGTHQIGVR